jgi:DNA-binding MarR family transcriptional regulator
MSPKQASPEAARDARRATVDAFQTFMHRVQGQRVPAILEIGISMAQVKVLHAVAASESLHASELAQLVGTTPSTISGLVDRLVDHGLLTRLDDPADRRQVRISTTPAGLELLDRFRELNRFVLDSLLDRVPVEQLDVITHAFEILDRAAIKMADDFDPDIVRPARKDPPS